MSRPTSSAPTPDATASKATERPTTNSVSSAEGPVERKVRADVDALITGHPMGEGLAELAFTLARTLDDGAGLAVAAVSRELRATLNDLAGMVLDDDDDLEAQLSTPVRDAEDPGEGDAGSGGS